jgi:diacylglycerol kinase family enzyme
MNVWILYNQDAGRGVSRDALREIVERAGHSVLDIVSTDWSKHPPGRHADLLVAAGGDGTVATAVEMAATSALPIAILPLGTANNIATTLGLTGRSCGQLVASWNDARRVRFDLGHAQAASRQWLMIEGAGTGLIPAGIAAMERSKADAGVADDNPAAKLAAALRTFEETLERLEPHRSSVTINGRTIHGEFLMVEVLNIRSIGPNLVVSSTADPSDGLFDVIVADRDHRDDLHEYIASTMQDRQGELTLPLYRARQVTIDACEDLHIDDERVNTCGMGPISISISPGAITMLA